MVRRKASVRISANFERNLDAIQAFLIEVDSPQAFDALLESLLERVIPTLEQHPGLGRNFLARQPQSEEAQVLFARVQGLLGVDGELREYIAGDYLILYGLMDKALYLLSIKHHRQLSFDLPRFWS